MSYFLASSRLTNARFNAFALSIFQSLLTKGNVAWSYCKLAFKWIKEVKTNLLNIRLTGVDITVTVTSLFTINFIQNQHIYGK